MPTLFQSRCSTIDLRHAAMTLVDPRRWLIRTKLAKDWLETVILTPKLMIKRVFILRLNRRLTKKTTKMRRVWLSVHSCRLTSRVINRNCIGSRIQPVINDDSISKKVTPRKYYQNTKIIESKKAKFKYLHWIRSE